MTREWGEYTKRNEEEIEMYLIWSHSKFRRVDEPVGSRRVREHKVWVHATNSWMCSLYGNNSSTSPGPDISTNKNLLPSQNAICMNKQRRQPQMLLLNPTSRPKSTQNLIIHDVCEHRWQLFALSLLSPPRLHIFQGKIIIITLSLSHKKVVKLSTHTELESERLRRTRWKIFLHAWLRGKCGQLSSQFSFHLWIFRASSLLGELSHHF